MQLYFFPNIRGRSQSSSMQAWACTRIRIEWSVIYRTLRGLYGIAVEQFNGKLHYI